jgi:hypothetical protein
MALVQAPPILSRLCFLGAAGWSAIIGFMWLVTTPESTWARVTAGLLLGAFVFVLVPQMIRMTYAQSAPPQGPAMSDQPPKSPTSSTGSITTTNQSGGVNNTGQLTINQEDKSPKRRMRDLFNQIDPSIMSAVTSGMYRLQVRMRPFEISQLQTLVAEGGSASPVSIAGIGPAQHGNTINNGSFGTTDASFEQRMVLLVINPTILQ